MVYYYYYYYYHHHHHHHHYLSAKYQFFSIRISDQRTTASASNDRRKWKRNSSTNWVEIRRAHCDYFGSPRGPIFRPSCTVSGLAIEIAVISYVAARSTGTAVFTEKSTINESHLFYGKNCRFSACVHWIMMRFLPKVSCPWRADQSLSEFVRNVWISAKTDSKMAKQKEEQEDRSTSMALWKCVSFKSLLNWLQSGSSWECLCSLLGNCSKSPAATALAYDSKRWNHYAPESVATHTHTLCMHRKTI